MVKKIFISCVTNEFDDLRLRRRNGLIRAGYTPVIQPDFPQAAEDTVRKLDDIVGECDAVVHILGAERGTSLDGHALADFHEHGPGAAFLQHLPQLREALGDLSDLSYTEFEAFAALHHALPLFVYTHHDPKDPNHPQRRHLDRLEIAGRYATLYQREDELADQIQADLRQHFGGAPEHRPFNLPGSIGALFKGRDQFLDDLRASLTRHHAAAVTATQAVHGLGGIGKTRLAIEYGHRHAAEYSALLFIRADSPAALRANLAELTGLLQLPEYAAPDEEIRLQAALAWLDAHPGWFLILDNVDEPDAAAAVEDQLGRMSAGHVLITSRLGDWSAQVEELDLDVLSEDAAVEFLLERTEGKRAPSHNLECGGSTPLSLPDGADSTEADPSSPSDAEPKAKAPSSRRTPDDAAARTLAQRLDGLALALEQAAAYIAEKRLSFESYLKRIESRRAEVLQWFDQRKMRYPASVALTWDTSFQALRPEARQLLDALAFLAPDPIPRGMIQPEDFLAELANYSLVRFLDDPPESFAVHRLVQEIVRLRLEDDEATRRLAWDAAAAFLGDWAPGGGQDSSTWASWQLLGPHCEAIFARAATWPEHPDPAPVPRLLNGYAMFQLYRNGDYAAAEPLFRRALEATERVLGPEHRDTLGSVNNLAALLESKGDSAAAEPLYRRALEACERVLGPEHPNTLSSVNNLAALLDSKGDYAAAEPLFRRALEARERVLGPEHPDTLSSVNNLAALLDSKGDYAAAEPFYRRALEARERDLGPEHPDTLSSVNNLAELLRAKGDYAAAEPLFRRALEARERVLGPEHPDTLISVNNLAGLLDSKGDYAAAEPLYRRALEAQERVLGPEHPDTLISVNNLAALLRAKGDYAAAEPLYRRALEARERVLGPEHPDTFLSVNNLAELLQSKGDSAAAEPLYRRALEAFERVLGPEHPDTLSSVNNLGMLHFAKGEFAEAEALVRRAAETLERLLGPEHPNAVTMRKNLEICRERMNSEQ